MSQIAKMEAQVEISSSASKFYGVFCSQAHLIPKACADKVKSIEVVQGGSTSSSKERVERKDDRNNSITFRGLEGEVMSNFKSICSTLQVTAKGNGSLVKWTLEYETSSESVLPPDAYLAFTSAVGKDVDAYLLRA